MVPAQTVTDQLAHDDAPEPLAPLPEAGVDAPDLSKLAIHGIQACNRNELLALEDSPPAMRTGPRLELLLPLQQRGLPRKIQLRQVCSVQGLPSIEILRLQRAGNEGARRGIDPVAQIPGAERPAVQHLLRAVTGLELRIRAQQVPERLRSEPLADDAGHCNGIAIAGAENILGEIRTARGLHQQIAPAGEAEHGDHAALFRHATKIPRVGMLAGGRTEHRQVRQQEKRGVEVGFQESPHGCEIGIVDVLDHGTKGLATRRVVFSIDCTALFQRRDTIVRVPRKEPDQSPARAGIILSTDEILCLTRCISRPFMARRDSGRARASVARRHSAPRPLDSR